jgi:drug/metabolite transporter (DMT)-like permease
MDIGLILALIAAVSFAIGIVLVRKAAGEAGEAFTVTAFSIFAGIPLFAIAISINGDWHYLVSISLKALGMLAAVGVIHFIIGRLWAYDAFRRIGANRSTPITQLSPIVTIALTWFFLDESLTFYVAFGALLMMAGVLLISQEKGPLSKGKRKLTSDEVKGILLSLGAALCWGITPVLIKPAVTETGSAVVGNFVSYTAAGIILLVWLINKKQRNYFAKLNIKKNVLPMIVAGLFTAAGQLLYFAALVRSPANVVAPLVSIEILFIFLLSFLVNRRGEVFTWKVTLGMVAAVGGTFLLFH